MTTRGRRRFAMRSIPLRELRPVQLPSIVDEMDRARIGGHPNGHVTFGDDVHETLPSDEEDYMVDSRVIKSAERVQLLRIGGGRSGGGKTGGKQGHINSIRIPADFRELLPDVDYVAELNEDGILFRVASTINANKQLPAWAAKNGHPSK